VVEMRICRDATRSPRARKKIRYEMNSPLLRRRKCTITKEAPNTLSAALVIDIT